MTLEVSDRGRRMPASPIRKLMPVAEAAKRRGVRVYHLNIGQPDLETPEPMRRRLETAPKVYAYSPSVGTPECLASFVEYYRRLGISLSADELIATTGGSEAVFFAMMACANEGDDVLLVEPFYTNYQAFATMAGVSLRAAPTSGEDGFHLPAREVWERHLHPRTKAVLLCNPNNPTGTVYTRDEIVMVAELCRDHGLFLILDEVYREFAYDGRAAVSALSLPAADDMVIVVDSLSKRYSACGIRLGCLVTRNRDVYGAALRMAQARLSPPGLAQVAACALTELGPDYTRGIVTEFQARRDMLYEAVSAVPGVFLRKPEGAFYFVARLPVDDAEQFARWLLTDFQRKGATVMVAPAEGFYATPGLGKSEVRIAYVLKEADLVAAVEIFAAALPAYRAAHGLAAVPAGGETVRQPDFSLPAES
jgi:aspartate aminotransferase